uniref:PHD finger protein 5A n=1 Tax=Podarcis muralis TaxID=64176 RepID=A0A670K791_PODMU
MAKHHPDLIFCRKQAGVAIGRLCEKCDGKCVICDSYVRPCTLVRICDECNYGSYQGRCVICGGPGVSDAYYCKECTIQEKDVRLLQGFAFFCSLSCNCLFLNIIVGPCVGKHLKPGMLIF